MNIALGLPVIEGTYALFKDANMWTRGADGRDDSNRTTAALDPAACKWCLRGGVTAIAHHLHGRQAKEAWEACGAAQDILRHYAKPVMFSQDITVINDNQGYKAVMALLRRSVKNARRRKR